jgi:acyl-CoA dehydrogenase
MPPERASARPLPAQTSSRRRIVASFPARRPMLIRPALLGDEGAGFLVLMQKGAARGRGERAGGGGEGARRHHRLLQGSHRLRKPISKLQNTRFQLASCATKVEVGRAFLDKLVSEHVAGKHLVKECSMAKLWQTEMLGEVVDACLQLFGGYGYMLEYPVTRAYMDARVQRIYAGTSEIMKVIIAKQLDL